MGAFFTNLHVRGKEPDAVLEILRPLLGVGGAFVSPEDRGWITIYPETTEDQDASKLQSMAQKISRRLESAVYATLVHDSDIFCYFLYENGRSLDEYNSRPHYFGPVSLEESAAVRGDARILIRFCRPGVSEWYLANVLGKGIIFMLNPFNMIFAEGAAKAVAASLGIRRNRALCGFRYAEHGGVEEDLAPWVRL